MRRMSPAMDPTTVIKTVSVSKFKKKNSFSYIQWQHRALQPLQPWPDHFFTHNESFLPEIANDFIREEFKYLDFDRQSNIAASYSCIVCFVSIAYAAT